MLPPCFPCPVARWWGRGYGVLARQQSVQYRTERSRTGSLKDFTDSQCTTIPDYAGGCVDPTTIEHPLKDCYNCKQITVEADSIDLDGDPDGDSVEQIAQLRELLSALDLDLVKRLLIEILTAK